MTRKNANRKEAEIEPSLILSSKPEALTTSIHRELPKSLIVRIERLYSDVESIGGSLLIKSKRLGDYLRAAYNIIGHGKKTQFFERSFGHLFDLRTAQCYMKISHFVEGNMESIREKLLLEQPHLKVESMSDEDVLRMLPISSVAELITERKKPERIGANVVSPGETRFTAGFEKLIAEFIKAIDSVTCDFGIQLTSINAAKLQSTNELLAGNPLIGIAVLLAGNSRTERKAIALFTEAFSSKRLSEALIISTHEAAEKHSFLHSTPEAIVRWSDLFSTKSPAKGFRDTLSISYLAPQARYSQFASSMSTLCSVKLPYVPS